MIDMKLTRQYFDVKDVVFGDKCAFANGVLTVNEGELIDLTKDLFKAVTGFHLEITKPGENARIIDVLDTLQPMVKIEGEGQQYPGFFSTSYTVGRGVTNLYSGFSIIESAALPWDSSNASSGLLYPRDAIIELSGFAAAYTPFSQMHNLVIVYELGEGFSSIEYDDAIRLIAIRISNYLAELTRGLEPDRSELFSTEEEHPELPGVVMVWQCQNQGPYSNTMLCGLPIDNLFPTLLHPNELLDGCVVSGNFVWPSFKVPTYCHVNHPVLLELYRRHGKDIRLYYQTTKSLDEFRQIVEYIQAHISPKATFEYHDTICRQVANRMPNIRNFAASHDLVFFVCGRKSSNGKILYHECKQVNPNTHLIDQPEEIDRELLQGVKSIGICGATSTPKWLMEECRKAISGEKEENI